jgi:hypothetical protein
MIPRQPPLQLRMSAQLLQPRNLVGLGMIERELVVRSL